MGLAAAITGITSHLDLLAFVEGLIKLHRLNQWAKAVMGCCIAWTISAQAAAGAALMAHQSWQFAAGAGLSAGAVALFLQAKNDPLLKGITFTYPQNIYESAKDYESELHPK